MSRALTSAERRAETRARVQQRGNPLDDYDPGFFERARGGSAGVPAGWPLCECGADVCPDREVPR